MTPLANSATWLTGYIPDLPTPFDKAGEIELTAFAKLCERQIQAGVSAIVESGGSSEDKEAIEACDAKGLTLAFTGIRHYRH